MQQQSKKKYIMKHAVENGQQSQPQQKKSKWQAKGNQNVEKNNNYNSKNMDRNKQQKYQFQEKQHNEKNQKKWAKKGQYNTYNRPKQSYQKYDKSQHYYDKPKFVEKSSSSSQNSCLFCTERVGYHESIWSCQQCYVFLHLQCLRRWIYKINTDEDQGAKSKKNRIIFNWKCPQCNLEHNQAMPKYFCYCGKFKNPAYQRDNEPHSCGQICEKKRGIHCPHPCQMRCHSGRCQPCNMNAVQISCECGKTKRIVKCSQSRAAFLCGKKCEKFLNCKKHKCQRNCHHEDCHPCKKKHMATCYCGKNQDAIDCAQDIYSCDQKCMKLLNCGVHKCQDKCHMGQCGACKLTPELQKTCPCGKYDIMLLTGDPDFRKKCQDPIPLCYSPCKKIMSCSHLCSASCHLGQCPPCKVVVDQACRCGLHTRKVQCWKTINKEQNYLCGSVCKKKKQCGQHNCNTVCCPYRSSPFAADHPCQLTCPKMLNCAKHTCQQSCHLGLCAKCPVIYSQPQFCPCGKTSLRPPVVCGTFVPECENICEKEQDCGHRCKLKCHYGPCRCYEQVEVLCRCGRQLIKTTCGKKTLCLSWCNNILQCGHKCGLQCHEENCAEAHKKNPCRKKCGKIKPCSHLCTQLCHPNQKCQDFSCEAGIIIRCQCGNRQTSILCGSKDQVLVKKSIVCNKRCENLKRFDILYKDKQIYYPNQLMQFAFKNYTFLEKVQSKLDKFITESDDTFIEVEYKFNDTSSRIALQNLFENHYHLSAHYYHHKKFSSFTLMLTDNSMVPKPCLSEYIKQVSKGYIKRTNIPFQYTISFQSKIKQKSEIIMKTSLQQFMHQYYVERKDHRIYIHFWLMSQGIAALEKLKKDYPYNQFQGEENIIVEQEPEIVPQEEIIDKVQGQIEQDTKNQGQHKSTEHKSAEHKSAEHKSAEHKSTEQKSTQQKSTQQKSTEHKSTEHTQTQTISNIKEIGKNVEKNKEHLQKSANVQEEVELVHFKPVPVFCNKQQYSPSKQYVQMIYELDDEELYGQKIDWQKYIQTLCQQNMDPEASEWRIRSLLIISSYHRVSEQVFSGLFQKIMNLYAKQKEKAIRMLKIQKIDPRKLQKQMQKNDVYLSDHEPQMMSYFLLNNYIVPEKIENQLSEECIKTSEIKRSLQTFEAYEEANPENFYSVFNQSDYIYCCALIPYVHLLRQKVMQKITQGSKYSSENFVRNLLFINEDAMMHYMSQNGITVYKRFSKSEKVDVYCLKEGQLQKIIKNCQDFIIQCIQPKRNVKYFLKELDEIVKQKYATRSTYAFGDFKESINPNYMLSLAKSLIEQGKK